MFAGIVPALSLKKTLLTSDIELSHDGFCSAIERPLAAGEVKCGGYVSLQTLTTTPAFNPSPMAVELSVFVGSLFTSCRLVLCDVISVRPCMMFASLLNVTSPTEYPVGTTLSRNSATVCRNRSNLVTWQHMIDESNNVILTKICII